jgi:hypothetical protein
MERSSLLSLRIKCKDLGSLRDAQRLLEYLGLNVSFHDTPACNSPFYYDEMAVVLMKLATFVC